MAQETDKKILVAAHQPLYLPWLGYFDKIQSVDIFCLVDTITFETDSFQHKNRIRASQETSEEWLSVPVYSDEKTPTPLIKDVRIQNENPWRREHWEKMQSAYHSAPHFGEYMSFFKDTYLRDWDLLVNLNEHLIRGLAEFFGIKTRIVRSSALSVDWSRENLHVGICRALNARRYMSGAGGNCTYLDEIELEKAGIEHIVQKFTHPIYPQFHGGFVPRLAAVDLLFNCGVRAGSYIRV